MAVRFLFGFLTILLIFAAECSTGEAPHDVADSVNIEPDTIYAQDLVELARQHLVSGRCDSATVYLERAKHHYEAAANWPRVVYCDTQRARCAIDTGRLRLADQILDDALRMGKRHFEENDSSMGEVFKTLGSLSMRRGDYDAALEAFNKALEIGITAFGHNHPTVADNYNRVAVAHYFTGEYERAELHYNHALRLRREHSDIENEYIAEIYNNLGLLYRDTGEYDRSVASLQKALRISQAALGEDHPAAATTLKILGETRRLQGSYEEAFKAHHEALDITLAAYGENHTLVADILNDLAIVYSNTGNPDKAITYYKRSLTIVNEVLGEQHHAVTPRLCGMGLAYLAMGDLDRALSHLQSALRIRRAEFGDADRSVGVYLNNIGSVFARQGDYAKARAHYERALNSFMRSVGELHPYVANQYKMLGRAMNRLGEHDEALALLDNALQIFRATSGEGDPYVATVYSTLGSVYDSLGATDRALAFYDRSLNHVISTHGTRHPAVAARYNDMGEIHWRARAYDVALAHYDWAFQANQLETPRGFSSYDTTSSNILSDSEWLRSLWGRARALSAQQVSQVKHLGDLQAALDAYYQAAHTLDRMQKRYRNQGSRLHWVEVAAPLMADAVAVSFALYEATGEEKYKTAAFYFAEKSKGSVLLGALSDARARRFAGIPDSLLKEERMLLASLVSTEQRLLNSRTGAKESAPSDVKRLEQEAFALTQQHTALIEQIEHTYPNYYKLKYDVEVATPERVQTSGLGPETALVEYMIGDEQVFIFTMTPADFNVLAVPRNPDLEQQVEDLRQGIVRQDYEKYTTNARALYLQLLDPVVRSLDARNLLIVPDGVLNYVPFESLLTDSPARSPRKDYGNLPYLIKRFAVSYAYSSTLLIETRSRQRSEPDRDYVAFAPVSTDGLPTGSPGAALLQKYASSSTAHTTGWGYLPMTRVEVTQIKDLFGQTHSFFERLFRPRSRVYLGKDARESEVMSDEMSRYRYVHFATHGFANSTSPESSGIVLYSTTNDAVSDDPDSMHEQELNWSEDGVLRLDEVYALRLNADVVVLSACETGLGPVARGEGILSLARGFLYAGASNVVASLWKADDVQTQRLMLGFYRNMLDGSATSSSLRRAKLNLIDENGRYARPYYWATFVLIGA